TGTCGGLVPTCQSHDKGSTEILTHILQLLRSGNGQQPEHQEQGHHGRHEVRESQLPVAAVIRLVRFLAPDYDRTSIGTHTALPLVPLKLRTCSSSSVKLGRSSGLNALRPNSTASWGA